MSQGTAEALAEAHEAYVAALLVHVADEQGAEPVADDADEERKEALVALTIAELRKQAKEAGASAADIKACGTGVDGKAALADLIIELGDDDEPADDEEAGAAAAEEDVVDEDETAPPVKVKKDKKPKKKDKTK